MSCFFNKVCDNVIKIISLLLDHLYTEFSIRLELTEDFSGCDVVFFPHNKDSNITVTKS